MSQKLVAEDEVIVALLEFLSRDLLQSARQKLPEDLQEIIDIVLSTEAGNCIALRSKMIQIKHGAVLWVNVLKPFSEMDLEKAVANYKNRCIINGIPIIKPV